MFLTLFSMFDDQLLAPAKLEPQIDVFLFPINPPNFISQIQCYEFAERRTTNFLIVFAQPGEEIAVEQLLGAK